MRDNNNHKPDPACAFGETLIAVLYGEATASENADFENHLKNCRECGEELSAFGTLRSAVSEWREIEFAPLALPNVVLPGEAPTIEPAVVGKNSRLQSLRAFFSSANFGWQLTAAGFAVFVILGFLFINSTDFFKAPVEVADSRRLSDDLTPEMTPVPKIEPPPTKTVTPQTNQHVIVPDQALEKTPTAPAARISHKAAKRSASRNGNLPRNRLQKTERNEELSILPAAEADDDSLRLTVLLEEIEPSS